MTLLLLPFYECLCLVKFPPEVLMSLVIKMAESEARLASGCSERIELAALIAAFHLARQQIDITAIANS